MCKVKVIYAGICGSDILHLRENDSSLLFHNMGHEIVGQIIDIEENEKGLQKGDWVVVNPFVCSECSKGDVCEFESYLHCVQCKSLGKQLKGGFSGEVVAPLENLYKLSERIENKVVGVLVDAVAVILHALGKEKNNASKRVLVIGTGTLACLTAMIAREQYGSVDMKICNKTKTDKINKAIAKNDISIIVNETEIKDKSYDVVFEAVGGKQTDSLNLAINAVKNNGRIDVLGVFNISDNLNINLYKLFYKQIEIQGWNSYCRNNREFEKAMNWVLNNEKSIIELITKVEEKTSLEKVKNKIIGGAYRTEIKTVIMP